jgi:exoribonuclease-2
VTNRDQLRAIAVAAMRARGLDPDFPTEVQAQVAALKGAPVSTLEPTRDLRGLLWCSIDNDDSRDLDQLSVAQPLDGGDVRVLVAIADVDAAVPKDSPVDRHAAVNTTSVYTPAVIFPMLPAELSTNLTSLNADQDRLSITVEFVVSPDGSLKSSDIYGATVRNRAKLAYNGVGAWLAGQGPLPQVAAAVSGMDQQLKIQDSVAQALSHLRHEHGALDFETIEVRHEFDDGHLSRVTPDLPNRAKALIENLMIAANGVMARFHDAHGVPSIRRVVREPERWDRIAALAASFGAHLPAQPDSGALAAFLTSRKAADPTGFPELSHTIIKLLGPGEYMVEQPGQDPPGHFGLAVKDYTHSTAPNRRYPDLLTQRLVKALLAGRPSPYPIDTLEQLAKHCTQQEDAANKVERQVQKSAAALFVQSRVGERFDAVVTGVTPAGTFVRVFEPPMEGMVVSGARGLDVGDRVGARLARVDVQHGFIDFAVS